MQDAGSVTGTIHGFSQHRSKHFRTGEHYRRHHTLLVSILCPACDNISSKHRPPFDMTEGREDFELEGSLALKTLA